MLNITFDTKDFNRGIEKLLRESKTHGNKALFGVAGEIMRLSHREVPIYSGKPRGTGSATLQNSGQIEPDGDDYIVGYNSEYAAYQHEGQRKDGTHVVRKYTNARSKKKFLEDPIKNNTDILLQHFGNALKGMF